MFYFKTNLFMLVEDVFQANLYQAFVQAAALSTTDTSRLNSIYHR
jgi:hypothetical protein